MNELINKLKRVNFQGLSERDKTLEAIAKALGDVDDYDTLIPALVANNLTSSIHKCIKEHRDWNEAPVWMYHLTYYNFIQSSLNIPKDQIRNLVEIILERLAKCTKPNSTWADCLRVIFYQGYAILDCRDTLKSLLAKQDPAFGTTAIILLRTLSNRTHAWKLKIIEDKQLITSLLSLHGHFPAEDAYWGLWLNLAHHEDARSLLPRGEVMIKAEAGTSQYCKDVYAIMCDDKAAIGFQITKEYIDAKVLTIRSLINARFNEDAASDIHQNFVDLLLPLVTLSINDQNKELLGKCGILEELFEIMQLDENSALVPKIKTLLPRSKIIASEALYDLAFNSNNRERIIQVHGLEILQKLFDETPESNTARTLRKNIRGIIYMCTEHQPHTPIASKEKHIMISYSWSVQARVKEIASELKKHGYRIWLDIEKMQGGVYDTMAEAIEDSEVVLICMTQKYKDSANCRFEGQYAVKRNVTAIPLLLQAGYDPDGWLGLAFGSLLRFNLSDDARMKTELPKLISALGDRCKGVSLPSGNSSSNLRASSNATLPITSSSVASTAPSPKVTIATPAVASAAAASTTASITAPTIITVAATAVAAPTVPVRGRASSVGLSAPSNTVDVTTPRAAIFAASTAEIVASTAAASTADVATLPSSAAAGSTPQAGPISTSIAAGNTPPLISPLIVPSSPTFTGASVLSFAARNRFDSTAQVLASKVLELEARLAAATNAAEIQQLTATIRECVLTYSLITQ